jgi:RHS repeat-associated protein
LIKQGRVYFYQLDQLGTPLSLTDSENTIVWQAHYSVFGKATVTVNKIDNPIRFQGQYFDNESGLHYNHFRYYDPETGRFISQDPIGLLGGINHYQYAPNHINWIDPLGLCAKEDGSVGLLGGIVGTADLVVTGLVNTGVDIVAGGAGLVTLAISGGDVDAAVHTIESVQEKQIGLLSQAGEKVAGVVAPVIDKYYEQNMAALGDATLEATGSPMLATAAHKSVELVGTVVGAGVVGRSVKGAAKVDGVIPSKLPDGIYADSKGVYGYLPKQGSRYDNEIYDFTDPDFVSRNRQIRLDYVEGSKELEYAIENMRSQGRSSEDIARRVVLQRNSQKVEARSLMTEAEVKLLEGPNIKRYGDPVGPTPDELFDKYGDWDVIIQSSMKKDPEINILLGIDSSL